MRVMTENPKIRIRRDSAPIDGSPIRLAQLVWQRNGWQELPIGPNLISAMERWLVPIRVYDYYEAPEPIRNILMQTPVPDDFDANTIARADSGRIYYIVVYNGHRMRERTWWSLAHEFGHIVLGHASGSGWHEHAPNERAANMFAAELLLPMGAVQELRRLPTHKLAEVFGTSLEATRNRLKDLTRGWLTLYTTTNIEEGRTRFVRAINPTTLMQSYSSTQEASFLMTQSTSLPNNYVVVQWSDDTEVMRLATCTTCGFENDSAFKHLESHCGACGELLINACENIECILLGLPLTSSYRYCGRCGQPTSWMRLGPPSAVGDADGEPDLPF